MSKRVNSYFYSSGIILAVVLVAVLLIYHPADKAPPKNVIVMISDGCGYNQVEAASLYQYGKRDGAVYHRFPVRMAMSTFSASGHGYDPSKAWATFEYLKKRPTDSAAAATALGTGTKTYNGAICVDTLRKPLVNLGDVGENLGKATGVITSVYFPHATPAGFSAHNVRRGNISEISREMLLDSGFEVIMGAGHPLYDNDGKLRDTSKIDYKRFGDEVLWKGISAGATVIDSNQVADIDGDGVPDPWTLVETRDAFRALAKGPTPKRVLGLVRIEQTLQYRRHGNRKTATPFEVPLITTVPTLAEMSSAALNVLDNDPDGFFLMIEGGAVDWAGHRNNSPRVIEEEIDFNNAVDAVVAWVEKHSSWDETLVVVTGDHETGYLLGPGSGTGVDGKPVFAPLKDNGKGNLPGMQWNSGGHTNSLIPIYAKGVGSKALSSRVAGHDSLRGDYIENTSIPNTVFALWGVK